MKLGLDTSGGDFAPQVNLEGVFATIESSKSDIDYFLIGDKENNEAFFVQYNIPNRTNLHFIDAPDTIEMGEHPSKAFTKKPKSSIAIGFKMLQENQIDAFCSTGNSGAMLVGSMLTVKTIPGVIRPCITSILPQEDGSVSILLDVGINADCKPDVLFQFGILGSIFANKVHKIEKPRVALLNIGEENSKGNLLSQASHVMMQDTSQFDFIGNIEGRDLFNNKADVIVCDGFTGNVVLKEAEAIYSLIKKRGINDSYFDRFNYELYGGTPILGINSNAIIGHGSSSSLAVSNMLKLATNVVDSNLSQNITNSFQ